MRGWVTSCWEQQSPLGAEDAPGLPCWLCGNSGPPSRAHSPALRHRCWPSRLAVSLGSQGPQVNPGH